MIHLQARVAKEISPRLNNELTTVVAVLNFIKVILQNNLTV